MNKGESAIISAGLDVINREIKVVFIRSIYRQNLYFYVNSKNRFCLNT